MAYTSILIIDAKSALSAVCIALKQRYDVDVRLARNARVGVQSLNNARPEYILVNPNGIETEAEAFLTRLNQTNAKIPVIVAGDADEETRLRAVYPNILGRVPLGYAEADLMPLLQRQRPTRTGRLRRMALAERAALVQANQMLERRVQEVMTLYKIGKSVASLTDLDVILARIVEAAVFMLRAEESSIMLVEPKTNELYLRAEKGLGEKQARGFNLKIEDTLIGSVVRTGRPVKMARGATDDARLKVVTGYLVSALLYVPLVLRGRIVGVLGVSNQTAHRAFSDHDQRLLEALADYAALAIEVARQHKSLTQLRRDLTVAHTIAAAAEELLQRLATQPEDDTLASGAADDPQVLSALRRIENAASILARMAETEAETHV